MEAYVADLLKRCEECRGKILIAVVGGEAAGYVTVLTRVDFEKELAGTGQ